jgi:hypothetical protein
MLQRQLSHTNGRRLDQVPVGPRHGPHRKRRFQQFLCCYVLNLCGGHVFTAPLPRNGRLVLIKYSGLQSSCHNILTFVLIRNIYFLYCQYPPTFFLSACGSLLFRQTPLNYLLAFTDLRLLLLALNQLIASEFTLFHVSTPTCGL